MMKNILTLCFSFCIILSVSGQDVKQNVISSAGGFDKSADNSISLSWTLGELVISTVSSGGGDLILTQGFQQSKLDVTAIEVHPELGIRVTIYPNPTSEIVNIKFTSPLEGEATVYLMGPDGRTIVTDIIPSGVMLKPIDMQAYPGGTYFLRIQSGTKLNVYKIIKL